VIFHSYVSLPEGNEGKLFEVFICWIQESYGNPKMVEKSQLEFNWKRGRFLLNEDFDQIMGIQPEMEILITGLDRTHSQMWMPQESKLFESICSKLKPLVFCYGLLLKMNSMNIVDLPNLKIVIFQFAMLIYQRVSTILSQAKSIFFRSSTRFFPS